MYDPVIQYVRQARRRPRLSAKTAARRAANAQAKRRADRAALYRRLQNHDPRDPRPELLDAAKHDAPVEVPASTMVPSPQFLMSEVEIIAPEDVRQFAKQCLAEDHRPGTPLHSFCPFDPNLDERALTLIEYRTSTDSVPLVHCRRCGFTLTLLDLAADIGKSRDLTMPLLALLWPEKVRSGEIDEAVAEAVFQHRKRRLILGGGRWVFAALVVEDAVRPAFGDWAALSDASLRTLLACPELPPDLRQQIYLLNILRNWMGEVVAVDVYAKEDYRPLFRHWLVSRRDDPLFAVPFWGACCDPTRRRDVAHDAARGHALELEAYRQDQESRRSIWLRCEPQAVLATSAPFEEMR